MTRRNGRGRGRLSAFDLLPEEASDIVIWASQELAKRERTQTDIYAEFRDKLIALQGEQGLAFDILAFSSFNRYSLRQAALGRELEETRRISSSLVEGLEGKANEDITIVALESLKVLIINILQARNLKEATPKEAMEMARALQSLVATSKMSMAQRQSFEAALEAATGKAIDEASAVAREAGVSAERIAQMRRDFLGVRPKPEAGQ